MLKRKPNRTMAELRAAGVDIRGRPEGWIRRRLRKVDPPKKSTWLQNLKEYNSNRSVFCIPRKGTPQHKAVMTGLFRQTQKKKPATKTPSVDSPELQEALQEARERIANRETEEFAGSKGVRERAQRKMTDKEKAEYNAVMSQVRRTGTGEKPLEGSTNGPVNVLVPRKKILNK